MLSHEQKVWLANGFCATFERCGSGCPIRHLCNMVDVNFGEIADDVLDDVLKIIAPELVEEPKPENPEPTGQRFTLAYYPLTGKQGAEAFIRDQTRVTREGFKPISSGVCVQNGTPCAWAIMSRPETPEEAKEELK